MMAVQIFTGQALNWNDFGAGFPNLPVYACMRHTGAGTNVTFDYDVLGHGHSWLPASAAMLNTENTDNTQGPYTYFYDTIATQLNCVNGIVDGTSAAAGGSLIGAIGYTDADQSTSLAGNTVMVNYNGVEPSRRNIRNGLYDWWSKHFLYFKPSTAGNTPTTGTNWQVFNAMVTYANDPAKLSALSSGKGNFWATIGEMNYMKANPQVYPGYVGASNPLNP
jgi:ABC-type phosphate transport system substrate-binding protein